ncbi:ACC synthase [Wilcoxina mikolae CBS 423.85]|nr:ACC synthase [Wilcoxina mikolae CBS 423.85]
MVSKEIGRHGVSSRVLQNLKDGEVMERLFAILANPYNPETNPNGIVNLGVAENALMYKELTEFVNKTLSIDAFACTYGNGPIGSPSLRIALSNFLNRYFCAVQPVQPEHIVVSSGVTAVLDMLAWTLADAEDGVMFGRPLYNAFPNDFWARAKVHTVPVAFEGTDPFDTSCVTFYERAIEEWNSRPGKCGRVRALVVVNPHNPLGQCYNRDTLIGIMKLCQRHQIHFISDEIYALSIYSNPDAPDAATFQSVLSIDLNGIIDPSLVHVLYGMSKDFSANGFRLGAMISQNNPLVLRAMGSIANFTWPSGPADMAWTAILSDNQFLEKWMRTNKRRLGEQYRRVAAILKQYGIKYHNKGNAALFLWVDLTEYLPPRVDALKGERQLTQRFIDGGVYLAPSGAFQGEQPGWFRIVFSMLDIEVGLRRMIKVLGL